MQTELTGRHQKITKALRTLAEEGLGRIEKIVGRSASAHVTFSTEKYRHTVEVAIKTRLQMIVGIAEAPEQETALRNALDKVEKQAIRQKSKKIQKHRNGKDETILVVPSTSTKGRASLAAVAASTAQETAAELHIVPSKESVAKRAMSIHEAVKEAEYRDRDVFVFRDHAGDVKVLHRTREGIVQLIEVP
ncbi:MAG TPA: ribosome-associated translation inhibitor RaiA [Acidobacteriaceae bacterium]|nr:ribosome-associated translation inhibitor RaiA [Acidobacteriaceae bacterium]